MGLEFDDLLRYAFDPLSKEEESILDEALGQDPASADALDAIQNIALKEHIQSKEEFINYLQPLFDESSARLKSFYEEKFGKPFDPNDFDFS